VAEEFAKNIGGQTVLFPRAQDLALTTIQKSLGSGQ